MFNRLRGPQVYQFFFRTVTCLPSLNKGITLPYLTYEDKELTLEVVG